MSGIRFCLLLSFFALAVEACKSREAAPTDVKHTFGKTRREPKGELDECKGKTPAELSSRPVTEVPAASVYLRKIAAQIMKANPQTFNGVYAPDKICLFVIEDKEVNAFAASELRNVLFTTGMLQVMSNDAEMASVVAHELSHITMQHVIDQPYDKLINSKEWQTAGRKLEEELKAIQDRAQKILAENDAFDKQWRAQETLLDQNAPAAIKSARSKLAAQQEKLLSKVSDSQNQFPEASKERELLQGLWMAVLPASPRAYPIPREEAKLDDPEAIKLLAAIVKEIKTYNASVKALNEKEKKALPSFWKKYDELTKNLWAVPDRLAVVGKEREAKEKEIHALKEKIVGSSLYNWAEEEADDVGFELYLRARWSPAFYSSVFKKHAKKKQENLEECKAQLQVQKEPERGKGPHPTNCWRIYNATIEEMKDHKHPYRKLIPNAKQVELLPGQLQQVKTGLL